MQFFKFYCDKNLVPFQIGYLKYSIFINYLLQIKTVARVLFLIKDKYYEIFA